MRQANCIRLTVSRGGAEVLMPRREGPLSTLPSLPWCPNGLARIKTEVVCQIHNVNVMFTNPGSPGKSECEQAVPPPYW